MIQALSLIIPISIPEAGDLLQDSQPRLKSGRKSGETGTEDRNKYEKVLRLSNYKIGPKALQSWA